MMGGSNQLLHICIERERERKRKRWSGVVNGLPSHIETAVEDVYKVRNRAQVAVDDGLSANVLEIHLYLLGQAVDY